MSKRTIRRHKPRKIDQVRVRVNSDATYVSAQDSTDIIFDHGDYEAIICPISPFLICNLSGQGAVHVRIHGSIEPGKPENLLQVSRLILGLKPGDRREVFFKNRNQRDMRKDNLELRGPKPARKNADAVRDAEDGDC